MTQIDECCFSGTCVPIKETVSTERAAVRTEALSLAPILRSAAQGRLLAILAANPDQSRGIRELASAADTSPTTAQREVDRAEAAGIVTSRYEGRNRRVPINPDHYLYKPLRHSCSQHTGRPGYRRRVPVR
jgi:DNA-binding transcriptional ArsR family regulator